MDYVVHSPHQLAQILRGERKARGLSQAQVGAPVKLLIKTVSKLENQPDKSTIESLFKILSALDLELVVRSKGMAGEPSVDLEW